MQCLTGLSRRAMVAGIVCATAVVTGGVFVAPAEAADATVTATGRFVYVDDNGNTIGIRHARVEMCDEDFPGCALMGTATTDANGNFTVTGRAGDWFNDLPDPRVKVIADGPAGRVETSPVNFTYCFQSGYHDNAQDGQTIGFGTTSPDSGISCDGLGNQTDNDDGAWQLHNNIREAWDYMNPHTQATSGRNVPKVRVFWPEALGSTFYRPGIIGVDEGGISVDANRTWNEGVVYHEYGHHVLYHFAESPTPDYNNGNCDGSWFFESGHCMWLSEKGAIHWTEGFPDYLGEVMSRHYGKDTTISSVYGDLEDLPHPGAHQDPDHFHTEGYTAAVLLDAFDGVRTGEDHDGNGSRDRLSAGFGAVWRVVDLYDPKPFDGGWNHVRDVDQFLAGFQALNPALASRAAEVYDENHLPGRPAMDLSATAATNPPATVVRGSSITVGDTTRNLGVTEVGETSWTRYLLSSDSSRGPGDIHLGWRTVGNLGGGGVTSSGGANVTVPSSTPPGPYFVLACADGGDSLFESSETNNCASSSGKVNVELERPNLRSQPVTGLAAEVERGSVLTLTDAVVNNGTAVAGASTTRFWLSTDSAPGDDVPLNGSRAVPTIGVGGSSAGNATLTVQPGTRPGAYHVVSCADAGDVVDESVEADNCAVTSGTVAVTAPDLRVSALSNPPSRVGKGERFRVEDRVRNIGGAPADASVVRYRLSFDTTRSRGDILLAGSRSAPSLLPGTMSSGGVGVRVPVDTPAAKYYLLACADDTKLVREADEGNNCKASTFTVTVRRG